MCWFAELKAFKVYSKELGTTNKKRERGKSSEALEGRAAEIIRSQSAKIFDTSDAVSLSEISTKLQQKKHSMVSQHIPDFV